MNQITSTYVHVMFYVKRVSTYFQLRTWKTPEFSKPATNAFGKRNMGDHSFLVGRYLSIIEPRGKGRLAGTRQG